MQTNPNKYVLHWNVSEAFFVEIFLMENHELGTKNVLKVQVEMYPTINFALIGPINLDIFDKSPHHMSIVLSWSELKKTWNVNEVLIWYSNHNLRKNHRTFIILSIIWLLKIRQWRWIFILNSKWRNYTPLKDVHALYPHWSWVLSVMMLRIGTLRLHCEPKLKIPLGTYL